MVIAAEIDTTVSQHQLDATHRKVEIVCNCQLDAAACHIYNQGHAQLANSYVQHIK